MPLEAADYVLEHAQESEEFWYVFDICGARRQLELKKNSSVVHCLQTNN